MADNATAPALAGSSGAVSDPKWANSRRLEALWTEATRERQRKCRRVALGSFVDVRRTEGTAYVAGLYTCGHSTCPSCGSIIREQERARLAELLGAHLAAGGGIYAGLFSVSHGPLDALGATLDAVAEGRARAIGSAGGSRWARDRRRFGVVGTTWHLETVFGQNGPHPHVHTLILTGAPLDADALGALNTRLFERYREGAQVHGRHALQAFNRLEPVGCAPAVAAYVSKGEAAASMAAEAARGDLKIGKGATPLALLDRYIETGDTVPLNLWRDWEQAMVGRRWRQWTPGLADRYGIGAPAEGASGEQQDAEDAAVDRGGVVTLRLALRVWRALTRRTGAVAALRAAVWEQDRERATALLLRAVADAERAPRRPAGRRRGGGEPCPSPFIPPFEWMDTPPAAE